MTEITQLAQHALNILTPLLPTAKLLAEKARDGAAGETGKTLLHWLIDSFKGKPAAASLERAIAEPTNPFREKALLNDIEEAATLDPAFREELARLVAAAQPQRSFTQTNTQTGNNNTSTQIQGSHNTINRG